MSEPERDRACNETVPGDQSGYCDCTFAYNLSIHLEFACGHDPFTCARICHDFDRNFVRRMIKLPSVRKTPRIIHQSWKSHQVNTVFFFFWFFLTGLDNICRRLINRFPPFFLLLKVPFETSRYQQSWLALQQHGWQYRFYTDQDNFQLLNHYFPWFRAVYDSFEMAWSPGVMRADVARYLYLYQHGGVYADLDFEPLQPLFSKTASSVFGGMLSRASKSSADPPCQAIVGQEPLEHATVLEGRTHFVCNAIMLSVPHHPFWLHVLATIQEIRRTVFSDDPVAVTGPRMLQQVNTKRQQS